MLYNSRTDLASESLRLLGQDMNELSHKKGIVASSEVIHGLELFSVDIINNVGAGLLGKPIGKYFTLDFGGAGRDIETGKSIVRALSEIIGRCCGKHNNVLVAALGNPDITPDALGSLAANYIIVSRHLKSDPIFDRLGSVALCRPGVLGTSGIESSEQVKLLCQHIKPELVIVIDALAGAELDKLCQCIQISTAGICPGSGVGNDRQELSSSILGTELIAIGVPTVIDAGSFGGAEFKSMFVTPRDIDAQVRRCGRLIGYGVNLALHQGLSFEEIEMLVGE